MCSSVQASLGHLSPGESATIRMWRTPDAKGANDWSCIFWCVSDRQDNDDCDCGEIEEEEEAAKVVEPPSGDGQDPMVKVPWQVQVTKAGIL